LRGESLKSLMMMRLKWYVKRIIIIVKGVRYCCYSYYYYYYYHWRISQNHKAKQKSKFLFSLLLNGFAYLTNIDPWLACMFWVMNACGRFLSRIEAWDSTSQVLGNFQSASKTHCMHSNHESVLLHWHYFINFYFSFYKPIGS